MSVEEELKQLEINSLPSERYSYLIKLKDDKPEVFGNIVTKLENFPIYISDLLHLSSIGDLSELDQTSIIDSNLSPQIAVITRESKFDEQYVVEFLHHMKAAEINISTILPIIIDSKDGELDNVIKALIKKYPGIHVLITSTGSNIIFSGPLFFTSDTAIVVPVYEFFGNKTFPIWLIKDDLYLNCDDTNAKYENFEPLLKYCISRSMIRISSAGFASRFISQHRK